jgi:hypothetical protein
VARQIVFFRKNRKTEIPEIGGNRAIRQPTRPATESGHARSVLKACPPSHGQPSAHSGLSMNRIATAREYLRRFVQTCQNPKFGKHALPEPRLSDGFSADQVAQIMRRGLGDNVLRVGTGHLILVRKEPLSLARFYIPKRIRFLIIHHKTAKAVIPRRHNGVSDCYSGAGKSRFRKL